MLKCKNSDDGEEFLMKLSEKWLREWVNPALSREELIHQLTMAGLAVESCELFENSKDDYIFEFELTPNRGDCLSVLGIAREVAALTGAKITETKTFPDIAEKLLRFNKDLQKEIKINIESPQDCPRYIGRVIKNFNPDEITPSEIQLKLRQSGVKLIHPIVDVMNFVMLELGQPLHAFDLDKIDKNIIVRQSKASESIVLLDGKNVELQKDTLVIADQKNIHAIAGIMGGLGSAVSENTHAIFIESAFFAPHAIAGRARKYGLHTDASHRFERGVDPELPRRAIERATELLSNIYSDLNISEMIEKASPEYLPIVPKINLRLSRVEKILGLKLSQNKIQDILLKLNMKLDCFAPQKDAGLAMTPGLEMVVVSPPSYRFDITEEIDLIEEIARIYGYENLPVQKNISPSAQIVSKPEKSLSLSDIKKTLIHQGFQEIITYSFISEKSQSQFDPENAALKLTNPISTEYAVMRTNLWSGLISTVMYNLNRQQEYLRFFETGLRFVGDKQEPVLSGVWAGKAFYEQWGETKRDVDYYDLKNNITQLLMLTREAENFVWESGSHPALHPAQTAKIIYNKKIIGFCGALHPELHSSLDIKIPVFLFEIELSALSQLRLPYFQNFSKFPTVRRDIALVVDQALEIKVLKDIILNYSGDYLVDLCVFDVYQGKNLPQGKKSLALGLIFQALDRTLLEEEIQNLMTKIVENLKSESGAVLRE